MLIQCYICRNVYVIRFKWRNWMPMPFINWWSVSMLHAPTYSMLYRFRPNGCILFVLLIQFELCSCLCRLVQFISCLHKNIAIAYVITFDTLTMESPQFWLMKGLVRFISFFFSVSSMQPSWTSNIEHMTFSGLHSLLMFGSFIIRDRKNSREERPRCLPIGDRVTSEYVCL